MQYCNRVPRSETNFLSSRDGGITAKTVTFASFPLYLVDTRTPVIGIRVLLVHVVGNRDESRVRREDLYAYL